MSGAALRGHVLEIAAECGRRRASSHDPRVLPPYGRTPENVPTIQLGNGLPKRRRAATGGLQSTAGCSRHHGVGPVRSAATAAGEITWSSVSLGKSANGNYFGCGLCEIHG